MILSIRRRLAEEDRTGQVEAALGNLFRDVSSHLRAGMTVEESLGRVSKQGHTILHTEIGTALAQVNAASSLSRAMSRLGERFSSEELRRSLRIILPAVRAGTATATLFDDLAEAAEERIAMRRDFVVSTKSYGAFIILSVTVLMPILLGVSMQFLDMLSDIRSFGGDGDASFGLAISSAGALPAPGLILGISIALVAGTALLSAMLASVIATGSWVGGLRKAPLSIVLAEAVFMVTRLVLPILMG